MIQPTKAIQGVCHNKDDHILALQFQLKQISGKKKKAASRATSYAALFPVPDNVKQWEKMR